MLLTAALSVLAMILDSLLGEARRFHPLVGFGHYAQWLKRKCYPAKDAAPSQLFFRGVLCWCCAVLPWVGIAIVWIAFAPTWLVLGSSVVILYLAIGVRSLAEHGLNVAQPLLQGNLERAREQLSRIVSRDTQILTQEQVATATVETVIENTHDAVIAPLVWFAIAGLPGVVLFRLSNTLDAMWGYKNTEFLYFGRCAARMDDVLGWLSARVTVVLFSCIKLRALKQAMELGRQWYSPNAGPVMAAGGAVLHVNLGGDAIYHGEKKSRPCLSEGVPANVRHIQQAIRIMYVSAYLWLALIGLVGATVWLY